MFLKRFEKWTPNKFNTQLKSANLPKNWETPAASRPKRKNNIEFVNSLPSYNDQVDLFQKITKIGDPIDRFNLQFKDLIENDEGGLFVFIGKKI